MKKIFLALLFFCYFLPAFSHGDDVGFISKKEKLQASKIAVSALNVETKVVKETTVDEIIKTTGRIEEIPDNHFDVNSPVQGKVISVLVTLGDNVRTGQPLAVIQSTEIARLQAEINQLKADVELAKSNYEREQTLYEKRISAKKEYEAAKAILVGQEARLKAAESNLKILTQYTTSSEQGTFTIKSLKSGTIIDRKITVGQVVTPNDLLFHGVDTSTVWASADIYERDLAKVKLGQKVLITLDGVPNKVYEAKLTYVGSVLKEDTRTLPVKATFVNKDGLLKPGAFLQFLVRTGEKKNSIVIPRTALVELDKEGTEGKHKHYIYLKIKDRFVPRKIEVEAHDTNNVEVISGLKLGEVIVTKGAYQLQYGEGGEEEEHKHEKVNFSFPTWGIVLIAFISLVLGILIGRNRKR